MIEGIDYFVRVVDFQCTTLHALIVSNGDGTVSLLLNSRISRDQQLSALEHEKKHLDHGDLFRDGDVAEMERDAG